MGNLVKKRNKISNGTRKGISFILLTVFLVFFGVNTTSANYFGFSRIVSKSMKQFGGKIVSTKAIEIEQLEMSGYTCNVPGTSISIMPIGSPAGTPLSYYIPPYISPMTKTTPAINKLIIGKYFSKTLIACILNTYPPAVSTVSLDTIILFGTSR